MKVRTLISPAFVILTVGLLSILSGTLATTEMFSAWRSAKAYQNIELLMPLSLSLFFILGCFLPKKYTNSESIEKNQIGKFYSKEQLNSLSNVLFYLTIAGYGFWIISTLTRGVDLFAITRLFEFNNNAIPLIKKSLYRLPGVTTLTQFGIPLMALLAIKKELNLNWKAKFYVILMLTLVRATLNAERIALIEVMLPFFVTSLLFIKRIQIKKLLFGFIGFIFLFAVFEYSRSWINFYSEYSGLSFQNFIGFRLLAYYATAINNGFLLIEYAGTGPQAPFYLLNFVYTFPVIGKLLRPELSIGYNPYDGLGSFLRQYGNPEFNNPNGFMSIILDLGYPLSLLLMLLFGAYGTIVYQKACRGNLAAITLFSSFFIGMLELPRYFYFTSGRAFPIIIAAIFIHHRTAKAVAKK